MLCFMRWMEFLGSGGDRKHAEYFFEFINSVARLCQEARDCSGSNVLLDAEVSSLQPAVDLAGFWIQKLMNSRDSVGGGLLYQTFQCYRKDTPLRIDMYLSWVQECDSLIPALKIVRGAYMVGYLCVVSFVFPLCSVDLGKKNYPEFFLFCMVFVFVSYQIQERQNAKQKRQPDIICDTIDETHAQYDSIAHKLVEYMLQGDMYLFSSPIIFSPFICMVFSWSDLKDQNLRGREERQRQRAGEREQAIFNSRFAYPLFHLSDILIFFSLHAHIF